MLRCRFCSDLAIFECTGNRFCKYHRPQHDTTHTGRHQFKDIFCQLSEKAEVDFKNEITRRLNTLKDCKNAFASATAEYIKDIQGILCQKIAEIDKLTKYYINLLHKEIFDTEDSVEIDKILSTRLELKELKSFADSKFKDYLQQEIIETKEIDLKNSDIKGYPLSNEGRYLTDIIRCCSPTNIPERMLREIMVSVHGEKGWSKAKEELCNLEIVAIDENLKLWSIFESRIQSLSDEIISGRLFVKCLNFFVTSLAINDEIASNLKAKKEIQEMLPHAEKIIEDSKINHEYEVTVLLNLATAYVLLEYNEKKVEKYVTKLVQKLNLMNYNKLNTSKILKKIGDVYSLVKNYNAAEKFYLQCLEIQEQVLPENHADRASLYMKLGFLYEEKAAYDKAEKFYLQCLKIHEQILPETHLD